MFASVQQEMGWVKNARTIWHFKLHEYTNLTKVKDKLKILYSIYWNLNHVGVGSLRTQN